MAVVAVMLGGMSLAVAQPSRAAHIAAENALTANTLHSGVPGVRFGFGEDGEVSIDTTMQETGGSPYPIVM